MSVELPAAQQPPVDAVLVDSVTDLTDADRDKIAITGSHGGVFSGDTAARIAVAAAAFSDAGCGREGAGISGLAVLDDVSTPAFAIDVMTARIGDAADAMSNGIVSHVNASARVLGVTPGQNVSSAAERLRSVIDRTRRAPIPPSPVEETRTLIPIASAIPVWALDSASLVSTGDDGCVVVTGSHGGLPGGLQDRALKARAFLAVFNDAGVGKDSAGIARLVHLDRRMVAAVTVGASSARIGSGLSTYHDGVVSYVNAGAEALGCEPGEALTSAIARITLAGERHEESR